MKDGKFDEAYQKLHKTVNETDSEPGFAESLKASDQMLDPYGRLGAFDEIGMNFIHYKQ